MLSSCTTAVRDAMTNRTKGVVRLSVHAIEWTTKHLPASFGRRGELFSSRPSWIPRCCGFEAPQVERGDAGSSSSKIESSCSRERLSLVDNKHGVRQNTVRLTPPQVRTLLVVAIEVYMAPRYGCTDEKRYTTSTTAADTKRTHEKAE